MNESRFWYCLSCSFMSNKLWKVWKHILTKRHLVGEGKC